MKMAPLHLLAAPLPILISFHVQAITNGQLDGRKHPAVGALLDCDLKDFVPLP